MKEQWEKYYWNIDLLKASSVENPYQGSNTQKHCPILYQKHLGISIFVFASPLCWKKFQIIGKRWQLQMWYVLDKGLIMRMQIMLLLPMKHFWVSWIIVDRCSTKRIKTSQFSCKIQWERGLYVNNIDGNDFITNFTSACHT